MYPRLVGWIGVVMLSVSAQPGHADDVVAVEVPIFGKREILARGCRIMEGSSHAGKWHEMSIGVARKAEWSLWTSSFNPGRIGEGQLVLSLAEKRQVDLWCDSIWAFAVTDEAKPSRQKGVPSSSSDWIWAVVVRRGERVRTVHGRAEVPQPVRPLVEFVSAKVEARARRAPLSELVLYFENRYHRESSLFSDGWMISEYRFSDDGVDPEWRLSKTPGGSLFFVRTDGSSGQFRADRPSLERIERLVQLAWPLAKRRPASPDPKDPGFDTRSIRKSNRRVWLIAIRRGNQVRTLEGMDGLPRQLERNFSWVRGYTAKAIPSSEGD